MEVLCRNHWPMNSCRTEGIVSTRLLPPAWVVNRWDWVCTHQPLFHTNKDIQTSKDAQIWKLWAYMTQCLKWPSANSQWLYQCFVVLFLLLFARETKNSSSWKKVSKSFSPLLHYLWISSNSIIHHIIDFIICDLFSKLTIDHIRTAAIFLWHRAQLAIPINVRMWQLLIN